MEEIRKIIDAIVDFFQQNITQLIIGLLLSAIGGICSFIWNKVNKIKIPKPDPDSPEGRLTAAKKLLDKGNQDRAKDQYKTLCWN